VNNEKEAVHKGSYLILLDDKSSSKPRDNGGSGEEKNGGQAAMREVYNESTMDGMVCWLC